MRSAMAAVSRAGRTSWTRRMWAPARMAAVLAMVVGSVVGEADPSAALRDDNKGALRDDNKGALRDDNKGGSVVGEADPSAALRDDNKGVSVVGEADPSAALRDDNKGALRDDNKGALRDDNKDNDAAARGWVRKLLRERPARMGKPSVWNWSRWASRG